MIRGIPIALLLLISSCGNSTPHMRYEEPERAQPTGELLTWEDLDQYDGKIVTLQGFFSHIQGTHGVITKSNGLQINLPHFDLFARGQGWFDYVDQRVQAVGMLHSYPEPNPIPGSRTPTLDVQDFKIIGTP